MSVLLLAIMSSTVATKEASSNVTGPDKGVTSTLFLLLSLAFFLRLSRLVVTVQNDEEAHQGIQYGREHFHAQPLAAQRRRRKTATSFGLMMYRDVTIE